MMRTSEAGTSLHLGKFPVYATAIRSRVENLHRGFCVSVVPSPPLSSEAVRLSEYIAGALDQDLPLAVANKTRAHILDTLAAMISGSRLPAGRLAARYVEGNGGAPQASVIGTMLLVPAEHAALANGMAAHA